MKISDKTDAILRKTASAICWTWIGFIGFVLLSRLLDKVFQ